MPLLILDNMPLNIDKVKSHPGGVVNTEVPQGADAFAAWILSPPYRGTIGVVQGSTAWQCGGRSTRTGLQAVLFDLDGVLVDTARFHYLAWKRLADELGLPFDERANLAFRGVGRMECLDKLLGDHGRFFATEEKKLLADIKNAYYLDMLKNLRTPDLAKGAKELVTRLHAADIPLALVSASCNAKLVLKLLDITHWFQTIIDGNICKSKHHGFLKAAVNLRVDPHHCIVIEDAESAILAAREAGMKTIGIGEGGTLADVCVRSLSELQVGELETLTSATA